MKFLIYGLALTGALCLSLAAPPEVAAQANRRLPTAPPPPPPPPPPGPGDWRTPDPENLLVIDTSKGRIVAELAPFAAPAHVERIKTLARAKFYDGLEFFRVVDGFMAQTGDPQNDGTGQSEFPDLTAEFAWRRAPGDAFVAAGTVVSSEAGFVGSLPTWSQMSMMAPLTADGRVNAWAAFCPGVIGAARGNDPNSANSQFFLMRDHNPSLERTYTGYGRVLVGLNVVRSIKAGEPVEPPRDVMTSVRIAADMPEAERPNLRVVDPSSAWFKARMSEVYLDRGLVFTPCSVDMPVESR
jgi:peptidylprolyl isomerase